MALCALFDSYCRTILRNAIRNYTKQLARRDKHEFLTDDPEAFVGVDRLTHDDYKSDHLYVVYRGKRYPLDNEPLYRAMRELSEREIGVLVLSFWLEQTDLEIAEELGVTDRTVRNIRSRAFQKIRGWFSQTRGMT